MNLEIEAGKSYKLYHPNGSGYGEKLHIDYILENPLNGRSSMQLIVCRHWNKNRKRWYYYTYQYYRLAIYNGWEYKDLK